MTCTSKLSALAAIAASVLASNAARAGDADSTTRSQGADTDVRGAMPIVAYTYSATGARAGTMGAAAYGNGLTSSSRPTVGGGGTVWGSPVDRLTLVADGQRDVFGQFAPSAAAIVRIAGTPGRGLSLGAIGKYKIDGFGVGPKNEIESEIESGLLLSYARAGFHVDANAITGFGLGDDGEIDSEGRLRLGQDVGRFVRVGVDGQARLRLNGATKLPGGRTWDFAAGPQMLFGTQRFYAAVTGGPATMGVSDRSLGWTGIVTIGGATL